MTPRRLIAPKRNAAIAAALLVVLAHAPAVAAPVADCDRLAAAPDDAHKANGAVGAWWPKLTRQAAAAIKACTAAVKASPEEPRLKFQLGRAFEAAAQNSEAFEWYLRVADLKKRG